MSPKKKGVSHFIAAFGYSLKGLNAAIRYESAFRQELAASLLLVPVAFWLGRNLMEVALLLASLLLVLIVELLNSAIEAAVDRIGSELHELSGRAKDLGSAAVMLTLFLAVIVWLSVAWSRWQG